jgi:hypothetical protein
MAIAYAIGLVVFVALVAFWVVRAFVSLTIQDPQSKLTLWLQKSFLSANLIPGTEMVIAVLVYTFLAFGAWFVGLPITAMAVLAYMCLQCIQWLYAAQDTVAQRFNHILLGQELCCMPA